MPPHQKKSIAEDPYNDSLARNRIELSRSKKLKELDLSNLALTALPDELSQLTHLEQLYIFNNQLKVLPENLGCLTQLKELSVSYNQLTVLPRTLGNLERLQRISVAYNRLTDLPETLQMLPELRELYLHGNPDLGLPEEVLGPTLWDAQGGNRTKRAKSPKEILDYYFSTRGGEGVALREIKLIVVGWGGGGKTSLVKRLSGQPIDQNEQETHGILIRPLALNCTDGALKVRVWDFGGQVVLHSMHEFFLTARSLYLLVVEQRGDQADKDAKYWLNLIRTYAPDAPVVIALNKSRCIERPIDKKSLEAQYGRIVAWVPTECLADKECPGAENTILKLRAALTTAAEPSSIPESRKLFPRKWVTIKNWLENFGNSGTNYMDYGTFVRECAVRGETDEGKLDEVTSLMHDLGIVVNYGCDERLRDTTILRPDWLANGIYALLRANLLLPGHPLVPNGVLTREKLGEIYSIASSDAVKMLNVEDYPEEKWEFLLRLMNLFQMSFPLTQDGQCQLCPMLLQAEPPSGTDEPAGKNVIRLRYEFDVLPAPLLPRFIVRTFMLVEREKLWQRGAMLRYPHSRARVWTTAEEKYLFVTVAGPSRELIRFISIIRGTLNRLFSEYRDLQVTEQWRVDGDWVPRRSLIRLGVLESESEDEHAEEVRR